jgi:hypothetical protein
MSFWKSLFGGRPAGGEAKETAAVEHEGYTVRAAPFRDGGEFQTAGVIEKTIDGERKQHKFVRAERFPSIEAATEFSLIKGRQIVDMLGERMFAERPPGAGG